MAFAKDTPMPRGTAIRHRPAAFLRAKSVKGYLFVCLSKDGERREVSVHQLVCSVFNGDAPSPGLQVNHKDGKKDHNAATNLEWVTASENVLHSFRVLGRQAKRRPVEAVDPKSGCVIGRFAAVTFVQEAGFHPPNVCAALNGRQRTSGGLLWRYAC
ncbi:MAG: HNH endonuclease [Comamonadaceae bacterium]|nr:MAG: HNH endonuclease [Comamonadaceae bacterium]